MNDSYDKLRSIILDNLGLGHTVTGDLLMLSFSAEIQTMQLTQLFSKYDIEALDYQSVWLLSKLVSRLHYEGVPREQLPRIKGIVRKFTVENGRSLCALPGILETLHKAGIGVMLLNGTAMKVFYKPTETRYSSSIDILVHKEDIEKAGLLLERQEFKLQGISWEQRTYKKNGVRIILHDTFLRANLLAEDLADIWGHSLKADWQGAKVLVPSPEMMLLILLAQGLEASCSRMVDGHAKFLVKYFLDIKFFLNIYPLRWELFIELARKIKLMLHTRLMLDTINQLYPKSVSKEVLNALFFTDHDVNNVQRLVLYNVAKLRMADAKSRHNVPEYYYHAVHALWNLNCYYGNRSSLLSNIVDFPRFIGGWKFKGIKGLLSKRGGYN